MIIIELNENEFIREFKNSTRSENFSDDALRELFQHYDDLSEDTGEPYKLDIIAICCEWTEFKENDLIEQYKHIVDIDEKDSQEIILKKIFEELENRTNLIYVKGGTYLVSEF